MNRQNSQRGFSLIELLIAMTVTIVIAGIASTLVAQSLRMRTREDARSDAIADAQRALNIVSRETMLSARWASAIASERASSRVRMRND